jgi:hypothetical protein
MPNPEKSTPAYSPKTCDDEFASVEPIADEFEQIELLSNEFAAIEQLPLRPAPEPAADSDEYIYWVSWKIPRVLFDEFVSATRDPIMEGDGPLLEAIEKYEAAKRIPPSSNVAPPLPKPFNPSLSVPPEIIGTQSLPEYRVRCAVCRSTDKGRPPLAHDCTKYQEDFNGNQ